METLKTLDSLSKEIAQFQASMTSFYDEVRRLNKQTDLMAKIIDLDAKFIHELKTNFLTVEEQKTQWVVDAEMARMRMLMEAIHGTLS
jgi:hypothetical protein